MGLISGLLNRASSSARRSPRGGAPRGTAGRTGGGGGRIASTLLSRFAGRRRR